MVESRWGSGFVVKAFHFSVCLKFFMVRGLENPSWVKIQNSTYTEPAHLRHGGLAVFSMSKSSPPTDQGTSLLRLEILCKAQNTKPDDWGVCPSSGPAAVSGHRGPPTPRLPLTEYHQWRASNLRFWKQFPHSRSLSGTSPGSPASSGCHLPPHNLDWSSGGHSSTAQGQLRKLQTRSPL